jgi:hypothetical protein
MDTWERASPSIFEHPPIPKLVAGEDAKANGSNLAEAEAPPLVTENFESTKENSEPPDKGDDVLKHSSMAPEAKVATPPPTRAKRGSSIGWRTLGIFGIISFIAGLTLSPVLLSKSRWDLQALHPAYESIVARLSKLVAAETSPVTRPVPDGATSHIANQLQSIGAELGYLRQDIRELTSLRRDIGELTSLRQDIGELTSLRQDIRSLSDEIAQIRKAQEDLIRAQAQSVRKPESPPSPRSNPRARPTPPGRVIGAPKRVP